LLNMRSFVVAVLLLIVSGVHGQDLMEKGLDAYNRKDYNIAISHWNGFLATVRGHDIEWTNKTYFNISQAYHFLDSFQLSYVYLDSILKTDSLFNKTYLFQARALMKLEYYDSAIQRLDISIRKGLNEQSALDSKANCYLGLEQWNECLAVIQLYENKFGYGSAALTITKARCLYELGEYSKAAISAKDGMVMNETNLYNFITIIMLYNKTKVDVDICSVIKKAEASVKEYQKSDPGYDLDEEVKVEIKKIKVSKKCS
jgi:tetratricopeptide (TPR) repeat protein